MTYAQKTHTPKCEFMHIHKYVVACVAHALHTHEHNKLTEVNVMTNKPKISKP
jgi:hypothetical protein